MSDRFKGIFEGMALMMFMFALYLHSPQMIWASVLIDLSSIVINKALS